MITRIAELRRSQNGFTLIELLVVVAIIALLATFAVPKLFDAINKSKKAPGQADLQTIAGAFDRYYMDQNKYPSTSSSDPATIKSELTTKGYLKTTTTFVNGWQNGYIYVTDASGSFYVFIDAMKNTGSLTLRCGASGSTHDEAVTVTSGNLAHVVAATVTAADVQQGCTLRNATAALATDTYSLVTN